jgi:hypothetical protein
VPIVPSLEAIHPSFAEVKSSPKRCQFELTAGGLIEVHSAWTGKVTSKKRMEINADPKTLFVELRLKLFITHLLK